MSAVPTMLPGAKAALMQVLIKGRVEARRRFDGKWHTRVVTPAADEYSHPQVVEVRSVGKLGEVDETIDAVCRLGGYKRKPFRVTDRDTGEQTTVTPVDHVLDLVE